MKILFFDESVLPKFENFDKIPGISGRLRQGYAFIVNLNRHENF